MKLLFSERFDLYLNHLSLDRQTIISSNISSDLPDEEEYDVTDMFTGVIWNNDMTKKSYRIISQ